MNPKGNYLLILSFYSCSFSRIFLAADLSMGIALLGTDILPVLPQALRGPQCTITKWRNCPFRTLSCCLLPGLLDVSTQESYTDFVRLSFLEDYLAHCVQSCLVGVGWVSVIPLLSCLISLISSHKTPTSPRPQSKALTHTNTLGVTGLKNKNTWVPVWALRATLSE